MSYNPLPKKDVSTNVSPVRSDWYHCGGTGRPNRPNETVEKADDVAPPTTEIRPFNSKLKEGLKDGILNGVVIPKFVENKLAEDAEKANLTIREHVSLILCAHVMQDHKDLLCAVKSDLKTI